MVRAAGPDLLRRPVAGGADVAAAGQEALGAARRLGLGAHEQAAVAVAVADAARSAADLGSGELVVQVSEDAEGRSWLVVTVEPFLRWRSRLPCGRRRPVPASDVDATEPAALLALLQQRESELVALQEELTETNRGVVALYGELEASAEAVRCAQREVFAGLEAALRPAAPVVPGVDLAVRYLPAQDNAPSGGDLYDWFVLPDGSLHVSVVDVAGHGVSSTRSALDVTHALRTLSREGHPLGELVARTDQLLTEDAAVATVLLARFQPRDGTLELAGGGHPPALLLRADGGGYLEASGRPIGYPLAGSDGTTRVRLDRGETVLLYTDGLVEVRRDIVEGLDTLLRCAEQVRGADLEPMLDDIIDRVRGGVDLRDDTLVLALRRTTATAAAAPGADPDGPAAGSGPDLDGQAAETHPEPEVVDVRLRDDRRSVREARATTVSSCQSWGLDAEVQEHAQLVVSELASNALDHGGGQVRLRLLRRPGGIRIEVRDEQPGAPAAGQPGHEAESGRGLLIVSSLATAWGTEPSEDGKVVWAHVDR